MPTLFFKGHFFADAGSTADLDMMRRIKAAFARQRLTQGGTNMALISGRNTTTRQKDALRGCSENKRQYTSIWDRWQNDETYRESQLAINGSDAWTKKAQIHISHVAPHLQRNRYYNLFYSRSVNEDKQASPPPQRPEYQDAKKALVDMHKKVRQDCGVIFIPKVERQRLRNQLDPSMHRYLEWLSTTWG